VTIELLLVSNSSRRPVFFDSVQRRNYDVVAVFQVENNGRYGRHSLDSDDSTRIRRSYYNEKGVARNRNRALENARGEICMLFDDDTDLVPNAAHTIRSAFSLYPDEDILTFQILTPSGMPYKRYGRRSFRHNRFTILRVSEMEIAFRLTAIRAAGLGFDERFGLGSRFPSGEGVAFLHDAISRGLRVRYVPEAVVIHPYDSSGKALEDPSLLYAMGALYRRLYGRCGNVMMAVLFLRKLPKYSRYHGLTTALRLLIKGSHAFKDLASLDKGKIQA
jgi:glycosyltransferase involved in cell wall biosynthesis